MRLLSRFSFLAAVSVTIGIVIAGSIALIGPQLANVATAGEAVVPEINLDRLSVRSVMYDKDGNELAVLHAEENRDEVPLALVPDDVITAVLTVEDEEFFEHDGISLRSITRAFFENVQSGEVQQGGSTITQQVVKNALLTPDRDLDRKIQEIVLARRLEEQLTKNEILERYINTVYLGNGAYGLQAASETYFGVGVNGIDMGQGALLASMIRNPSNTDPFRFPEQTRRNWRLALDSLIAAGHMTEAEAAASYAAELPTEALISLPKPDDYFIEQVKQELLDDSEYGYSAVFQGGLEIFTTFDPRAQRLAEKARDDIMPDTDGLFSVALASIEPSSGAVRAMVGGPGFDNYKYNLATQGLRQPGSSFKTFVLTAALENGASPNDTINGLRPCDLSRWTDPDWEPRNFGDGRGAITTLRNATLRSYNCSFARLGIWVGVDKVIDVAQRMGISSELEEVPAIALGTEEVSPLEMASAYGVLANDGVRHDPYYIERIEDRDGNVLFEHKPRDEVVLEPSIARAVTSILRENVEKGTGTRARLRGRQAAGKTGTAQDFEDAWFVGYTPQLATAVWMGSPAEKVSMSNVGGIRVTGGSYPARIWGQFMNDVLDGVPAERFPSAPRAARGKFLRLPGERYVSRAPRAPTTTSAPSPTTTVTPNPDPTGSTTPPTSSPTTTVAPAPSSTTTTAAPPPPPTTGAPGPDPPQE